MPFVRCADSADQFGIGVSDESDGIWVQRNMRTVFLAVAGHPIEKFLSFFRRLDADAEDLYLSFQISFPLVHEGRHLGPAPGSPASPVKEHDRGRRAREHAGKLDRDAVDIFEDYCGKRITDC